LALSLGVVALFLIAITEAFAAPSATDRDLLGLNFDKPIADSALVRLLDDHSAQPLVFYFVAGDLYGTHRTQSSTSAALALVELRAAIARMQRGARAGAILRARNFVNRTSAASLEDDPRLHEEAAYIIHRYRTSVEIEADALAEKPLVYAVELLAPKSALSGLRRDPAVAEMVEAEYRVTRKGITRIVTAPKHPEPTRVDLLELESQTSSSLYKAIVMLSELAIPDGEVQH
jgi:hypothetical protein